MPHTQNFGQAPHQRATLARQAAPLDSACGTVDWVLAAGRSALRRSTDLAQRHPLAAAGLVAGLIALRPRRAVRWVSRGLLLWKTWRTLRRWLPHKR